MPRKISTKERNNGMKYCTYCKPQKVHAIWRNTYLRSEQKICFACDAHKHLLIDGQKHVPATQPSVSEHLTEADYQTWMRL